MASASGIIDVGNSHFRKPENELVEPQDKDLWYEMKL